MNYIHVPPICFKRYHQPNFYHLTWLYSVTYRSFVWCINMVFILRTQMVVKSHLEITRFNLSKDLSGLLKMLFGELRMRFLPTAPIHIVCYIQNFFDCLEVSKCVFIWNMIYIRVPLVCLKSYPTQMSINVLYCSRLHAGFLSDILTWSFFWEPNV
jgi:hypothetical protein